MNYIIGLSGLIGSGKSMVSKEFTNLGAQVIDADKVATSVIESQQVVTELVNIFGENILDNKHLNRARLRAIIFANKLLRIKLEMVVHPLIFNRIEELLKSPSTSYTILVVPLLWKLPHYLKLVHRTLFIRCREELLIKRTINRDKCGIDNVKQIIQTQIPPKIQEMLSDDLIDNNGNIIKLNTQILTLHQKYQHFVRKVIV